MCVCVYVRECEFEYVLVSEMREHRGASVLFECGKTRMAGCGWLWADWRVVMVMMAAQEPV